MRITRSPQRENYLKAIAEAQSEGETVKAVTLSRWLRVSAQAVTMAINRLKRDTLIQVDDEGIIGLTCHRARDCQPRAEPASSDRAHAG